MKWLFWTHGFWPEIGGIETQALYFALGMQERGHQIRIICNKGKGMEKEIDSYRGIPIRRFDFELPFVHRQLFPLRQIDEYLALTMKEYSPDVILMNDTCGWSALIFSMLKKHFRSPIVVTVHSPIYFTDRGNPQIETICKLADSICCVSDWVYRETLQLVPWAKEKMRIIRNGLAFPKIAPSPLPFSPPHLLLLGRFTSEKGFDVAIKAFALLRKRGSEARLIIAGDGPERARLQSLVEEFSLSSVVQFLGAQPREAVPEIINRATLVLAPSYFESFGLTALEAMQMGRPVIASHVGGLSEVIEHGVSGLFVPPGDSEALCCAIETLLRDPQFACRMGSAAIARATQFSLEENLNHYEALF